MPRVAEPRPPAAPVTDRQRARRLAILRAARALGTEHDLEHVQMQEVARDADVALSTLYRYFPSKVHLFVGLLAAGVERFAVEFAPGPRDRPPDEAVASVLLAASHRLLAQPVLSASMLQASNAADPAVVPDVEYTDGTMKQLLLDVVGITDPSEHDHLLVRLVLQSWYGVLQTALNGRLSREQHDEDIREACRLLLAPWAGTDHADRPALEVTETGSGVG